MYREGRLVTGRLFAPSNPVRLMVSARLSACSLACPQGVAVRKELYRQRGLIECNIPRHPVREIENPCDGMRCKAVVMICFSFVALLYMCSDSNRPRRLRLSPLACLHARSKPQWAPQLILRSQSPTKPSFAVNFKTRAGDLPACEWTPLAWDSAMEQTPCPGLCGALTITSLVNEETARPQDCLCSTNV